MASTNTTSVPSNASQASGNASSDTPGVYDVWEVVVIILITGPLSLVTIIGNLLVMISFRVNSHLRTVNNFFLLSLAVADLILGMVSMNLYTTYIIMGHWTLGNLACDIWLAIDYVASNASVMNLLIISFDRFFSVTRPLTYRVKRTPQRAAIMISLAWAISFVLWAPAILFWQYVEGKRTVPKDECHIQFLKEPIITFGTAIAAFYLPVTIMIILYWRVYRETENRARGLTGLLGSPGGNAEATRTSGHRAMATSMVGSTSSSSGSSAETPAEEQAPTRTGRPSCLPLLRELPHTGRSCLEASSSGRWTVDEEGPSSTSEGESEREAGGLSGAPVRMPLIAVSKDLGEIPEGHDQSCRVPRRQDSGANPTSSQKTQQVSTKPPAPAPPKVKKRQNTSLIREKKAARTLSAILLAFILTWTPYNIMVLVSTFCEHCVPEKLWHLGYWLCYVNSTINPMCYALCNESFRVTFKMLLLCRWDKRKWGKPHSKPLPYAPPQKFSSVV